MNTQEIKIGVGLGDIKFGISREDLTKLIGEPDEKDLYNASGEEEGFLTESWHYDELEFSVSFDEEDNWRLTTISTSSPDCKLKDKALIGLSIDDAQETLEPFNLGDNSLDDLSEDGENQKLLTFLSSSLNLWFEDNELSEVQWGVLWKTEDTPHWPS